MNPILARKTARAGLLAAALFLGACVTSNEDKIAVDPQFKNAKVDAQVAGRTLMNSYSQSLQWNSTATAPTGLEDLNGISTGVGSLQKAAALAKGAADIDIGGGVMANLDDTGKGFALIYHKYNIVLNSIEDTAIVKWDDRARDTAQKDKNIISFKRVNRGIGNLRVETSEFADADGDGLVNAVAGGDNKVKITFTVDQGGSVEKTEVVAGAGKDENFDTEDDNIVYEAKWTRSKDGVVIGTGSFQDADGDGIVVDNSKDCMVLVQYSDIEPKDRPLIERVDFKAKLKVLAHKAGNEPKSFSYVETTKNGRTNSATLKNRAGGEEIVKGDTMYVTLETTKTADDDTLQHAVIVFAMNPGQDLSTDADDSCYSIHVESDKRFGLERHAEFDFVSASAIPHGQLPTAGTFSGEADYANGTSVTLKGSFSPTGFSAEYKGPDGSAKVEWSLSGILTSNP
ncbi:MAG: hypothetical protein JF616_05795 [Fibrobacteres bacterium]|jgi:hypothetical protein|nr:hypothetical protein [Fibrobacterota bacterium]